MEAEVYFSNYARSFEDSSIVLILPFFEFPTTIVSRNEIKIFEKENFTDYITRKLEQYNDLGVKKFIPKIGITLDEKEKNKKSYFINWVFQDKEGKFIKQFTTQYLVKSYNEDWRIVGINIIDED